MSSNSIAHLQSFSEEDKKKLSEVLLKKLFFRVLVFFSIILVCVAIMVYFNKYSSNYRVEDNLDLINVVFVMITVLCGRLLISEIIDYRKELSSSNKKIIHTRVVGRKGDKIILGNKLFSKEEILLNASDFDSLQGGDEVVLEVSAKSNALFSVKKVLKQ